jgi:hypothetical protein
MNDSSALSEFDAIRPHVMALLELHRAAQTEEARSMLAGLLEEAFFAASWHIAKDLLENGWRPGAAPPRRPEGPPRLRVVGGVDAA